MPEPFADTHPSRELLRRFGNGELPGPEADTIQGHVETCEVCSQMLRDQTRVLPTTNRDLADDPGNEATGAYSPATMSPSEKLGDDLPERVGRYRLEHEIARGGMGQVVRVNDEVFQRPLAMKIALEFGQTSQDSLDRFVREARVTGQLQHPGIPPVQEMGQLDDGRPYFIMKLIEGSDLKDLLRNRSSAGVDLPRFVAIFGQICQTLGYAHSHGIIHRDLKPANIMVGAFGEVQVMDWGLAKFLTPDRSQESGIRSQQAGANPSLSSDACLLTPDPSPQETAAGSVMGTSAYIPPEQARGEVETLDARCDVFGLGGILCEILTGKPPFVEKTAIDNLRRATQGDLSDASARLDACGADTELVDLAKLCLAPNREDRPSHAGVVAEGIARYQAALQERIKQAEIAKAAALVKAAEERKRRRVSLALTAAVVVLIVGGGAGAMWYQGEMARQNADKSRQDSELVVRREYLNKEVSFAVDDAEQRRQDLLERLANQQTLNELLSDIDQWQRALNEAQVAWRRAKTLADGSPELVDEALAELLRKLEDNLDAAEKDWDFGKACDDARLTAAISEEGTWNPRAAAQKYAGIFTNAGLDVLKGNAGAIAAQIKKSPIQLVYLAALDHWADVSRANPDLLSRLFAIANGVDTDPWRKEYRSLELRGEKFQAHAAKVDLKKQSPQLLLSLAHGLHSKSGAGATLLRKVQGDHPRDFWIFFGLGNLLKDPVEREGCYRAALAIRPSSGPTHVNLGVALLDKNDVGGAIEHFRKALAINPNLVEAHGSLGNALRKKKKVEEAIQHYRQALDINPNSAPTHNNLGNALHDKKEVEEAIKHFHKAIEINPKSAAAHVNLAAALRDKKDLDGAIEHGRKALLIDPNLAEAHVNLGNALRDKKDVAEAIQHYLKAIEIKPNLPQAHHNLAFTLHRQKDVEGAIKCYRKALDIDPDDVYAHNGLALALHTKKDLDGASKHYRKALDINPDYADAHYGLGNVLYAQKDGEAAIKQYLKALAINPASAEAHYSLGIALQDKKDVEGAIRHYLKSLDINPDNADAHNNLGIALRAKKDVAGAIEHYRKALAINPNSAMAHNNLGAVLAAKKDMEEAILHFRKALDIDPNDPQTHANLGTALSAKKDVDGAIKHYRAALEINPNFAEAHYRLGNALSTKKDAEGALQHYRKAIEINPNFAAAYVNLGSALHDKNDLEGAIKQYHKALDIDPNHADAHYHLAHALAARMDAEGAIEHYRKAIAINPSYAEAHANLGAVLLARRDAEGASQHFRKAIDIDSKNAQAHSGLGAVLYGRKDVNGAIQSFRKAIDANPNYGEAHSNLGAALHATKDLEGALQHLRKAVAISPNDANARNNLAVVCGALSQKLIGAGQFSEARAATLEWLKLFPAEHPQRKPAQQQLQRCDQLLALDKQLSAILLGEEPPNNADGLLALADLCLQYKQYYAGATRFYAGALIKEPQLADDLQKNLRYSAASAASLAAAGKGKDAAKVQDRTQFRRQAHDWLRGDLALCRKQSQSGNVAEVFLLTQKLPRWQRDPALAGVRDAKELAGLPKDEQQSWQQLWTDVTQLLKETDARFLSTHHQGTLTVKQTEQVYDVKMLAGKSYVFDLESTQFDAYLRLENAKGKVLAENDDISPDNQNSRLIFSPKEAGVYRIIATSFQQQGSGAYTLTIREFAGPLGKKNDPTSGPASGRPK